MDNQRTLLMTMKRFIAVFLAFLMATSLMLTALPAALAASDYDGHWADDSIGRAVEMGWFADANDTRPNASITRAEFVTMINRMMNYDGTSDLSGFSDVDQSDWYYSEFSTAVAAGYIQGSSGKLNPTQSISRNEAVTIFARINGLDITADYSAVLKNIRDGASIPTWVAPYAGAAISAGLIAGTDNNFNGGANITRAETAVLLERIFDDIRVYAFPGTYGPETGTLEVGSVIILSEGVTLRNMDIKTDITIAESVGEGDAILENITVAGTLYVSGGGSNSIYIIGGNIESIVITKDSVHVVFSDGATFKTMLIEGEGVVITLQKGSKVGGIDIQIDGVTVNVEAGATVQNITIDASGTTVAGAGTVSNIKVLSGEGNTVTVPTTKLEVAKDAGDVALASGFAKAGSSSPANIASSGGGGSSSGGGPNTSTTVSATTSDNGRTVIVTLTNGTFSAAINSTYAPNWTIGGTQEGLALSTITRDSDTQMRFSFTGTVTAAGTLTIKPLAAALATGSEPASPASVNVKIPLVGSFNIAGTNKVGETLTIDLDTIAPQTTLSYEWKAGTEVVGTTDSYVIRGADVDKVITCTIASADAYGTKTATFDGGDAVPYTLRLALMGTEGTDAVSFPTSTLETTGRTGNFIISYTIDNHATFNYLTFRGVGTPPAAILGAATGTATYTLAPTDAVDGVITITAIFMHTSKTLGVISFANPTVSTTYGTAPAANTFTPDADDPSAQVTYTSSNTSVAEVDATTGAVTVTGGAGTTIIKAVKTESTTTAAEAQYTLTVNPKALTITGLAAQNKVYDGTTAATLTGTAALSGVVSGDETLVSLSGTPSAAFASKDVAAIQVVTVTGYTLSGTKAGNYTLSQPISLYADITKKDVTITGLAVQNKVYDGGTTATLISTGVFVDGKIAKDAVIVLTGTATFADKNVANNITVTFTDFTLGGTDALNYNLAAQPASVTANITKSTAVISGTKTIATAVAGSDASALIAEAVAKVEGVNGETFTGTWACTAPTAAGTSTATFTITGGTASPNNYNIPITATITFTVITPGAPPTAFSLYNSTVSAVKHLGSLMTLTLNGIDFADTLYLEGNFRIVTGK